MLFTLDPDDTLCMLVMHNTKGSMLSEYGINIQTAGVGLSRYRRGDGGENERWSLSEAEEIAAGLLRGRVSFVSVGNGDHEFRMWSDRIDGFVNFDQPGIRWAAWYVDVEINGRRWRYRPVADLDSYDAADELAESALELAEVTKIWVGASDGSEEFEQVVREG